MRRRKAFLFLVLQGIIIFVLYKCGMRVAFVREFFIERRCGKQRYVSLPPRKESAMNQCENLIDIAVSMLNGEKIQLPFDTANTRWKFKETVDLSSYSKTNFRWNYPWEQANSRQTMQKARYYNVSAKSLPFKKYFLTFAESCCTISKKRAVKHALEVGGFDIAKAHDMCSVKAAFRKAHRHILFRRKGAGYWLWKPYLLLKTLIEQMSFGDVIMYEDAGSYLQKDAGPVLKLANESPQGIVVFSLQFLEKYYTKGDTFLVMQMDYPEMDRISFQTLASFVVLRKDCNTLQFVMEWLAYSSDARCVTDDPNILHRKDSDGFIGHRHDQSVLSLLSKKWGLPQHRDPASGLSTEDSDWKVYGFASGPYEQLIVHDRFRSWCEIGNLDNHREIVSYIKAKLIVLISVNLVDMSKYL